MKNTIKIFIGIGLLAFFINCESVEQSAEDPTRDNGDTDTEASTEQVTGQKVNLEGSSLTIDQTFFSPNGDGIKDIITINPKLVNIDDVKSFEIRIIDQTENIIKGMQYPVEEFNPIEWDGTDNNNQLSADGVYRAELAVFFNDGNSGKIVSNAFTLDNIQPQAKVDLFSLPFSPDNDGEADELVMRLQAQDSSKISNWKLQIDDFNKERFIVFDGLGGPPTQLRWDGFSSFGKIVQSGADYYLTLTVTDKAGNSSTIEQTIPIDILTYKVGDRKKIPLLEITFAPYTSDFLVVDPAAVGKSLNWLALVMKKYSTYKLKIEGHALNIYWADKRKAEVENRDMLMPLSKKRAELMKSRLIELGVQGYRITTEGLGSTQPIVPFSDFENRWKNRRVEFFLIKG